MHATKEKKDDAVVKGKVDFGKIRKGHVQRQSGAGQHKNWRRERRQDAKIRLRRESE